MKKEITMGQLISVAATLLIALGTGWITLNNKVSVSETKIRGLEDRYKQRDEWMQKMEGKFDNLTEKVTQVLIKLENKKDR